MRVAQSVKRLGPVRLEANSLLESLKCVFILLQRYVGNSQVEIGVRIVWLERQRFVKGLCRFFVLADAEISRAQVVIDKRIFRRVLQGVLISLDRLRKLAQVIVSVSLILKRLALVFLGNSAGRGNVTGRRPEECPATSVDDRRELSSRLPSFVPVGPVASPPASTRRRRCLAGVAAA